MNVTLNSQISATMPASAETTTTTTYKPQTATQTTWGSGYQTDIADKVMDNEAYGHGLTAEDIMQQAANTDVSVQKDFMVVMSNTVSGEDLQKMQEEGFNPASVDVETYVNVVDQIKVTLAQAGVEITGYNDNLDVEKIEEITGSRINAEKLADDLSKLLPESDIPITNENVEELVQAIMEASGITEISDEAIKYMVVNHKAPTIENIYKAQFSSAGSMQQAQGYYSDGFSGGANYYAKKADSINWENLEKQMASVVKQAGLDSDAMDAAKWLVESGIELNVENLTLVSDLKNLKLPLEQQELEQLCVTAMKNGKTPTNALLTGEEPIAEQAKELMETVESISDEAVHAVAESGDVMNIKNLAQAQETIEMTQGEPTERKADEESLKEIEAKRQLEEIRLMMSEEANRRLLKAGISVDTTELSKLVEALRETEEALRASLYQGGSVEENAQRALLFEETITKTKEISQIPAAFIGKMITGAQPYTLNRIHEEGTALQNELQEEHKGQNQNQQRQASQAYETLMTAPRKDLGDNIKKAFRNVDDILEDMKLEMSDANRRAVRILGYNSMEITEENINKIKEADSQINGVINKMTPATTLQMIREQKNPLEMTIKELDNYLNDKSRDFDADAEKYSVFLQKLDRADSISESEREAYIGIYRLFRQIEKSDGAVIGSVVASGAQMNFKNMLSAIRSNTDKNMDIRVDDGFGALEELITKGKAIDEQIMSGFHKENSDDARQQQERYYARLSGEINTELAEKTDVEKLKDVEISESTTIEQFADSIKMTQMSERQEKQDAWKKENLKNFQESLQEAQQIEEQVIESLIDYGQTVSLDNIYAAEMLMVDRGSLFRQIIENADSSETDEDTDLAYEDVSDDTEESILAQSERFTQALTGKESAGAAYQEMIDKAGAAVEKLIERNGVSYIDVKAAQSLYKGLALAGNLAREENYEVPMNIKGEITSVNLKIYHNAAETGKVSITFETDALGKVAAEFDVTDKNISGMIVYENKTEAADFKQLEQTVKGELAKENEKNVSISLVQSNAVDFYKFGQDRQPQEAQNKTSTAVLYQTAKAFLTALKETEK
ncbi:MAG: hypothetical protein K2N89_06980 [Lachnospiraceae bacterium]|nr:hypothetical protein [Lachnospiraceae bacterium]